MVCIRVPCGTTMITFGPKIAKLNDGVEKFLQIAFSPDNDCPKLLMANLNERK